MDTDSDTDLATRLAAALDRAFPAVVDAHQDRLYSIALRILGEPRDAEEAAQDALIRAYRALAGWPPERIRELRLRPWLATIVVNACRTRARRRSSRTPELTLEPAWSRSPDGRAPRPSAELAADPRHTPDEVVLRREARDRLASQLAALPERYRVPIVLRHVGGLSTAETAAALGRPEGTVKAQLHRGLTILRGLVEASDAPEPPITSQPTPRLEATR